ncbi:MAG: OmpA family protein [Desulfobacterales bacterium]|nr:OmpA family protein [Desulfobacterales bacterium]
MNKKWVLILCVLFIGMVGCAKSHFGVTDRTLIVPPEVAQTEEAIASAKQSEGATYCPEKIAQAEELAKQAMIAYWSCTTCDVSKAMNMLAQARDLANEAKACQPPPAPTPPPAPAPAPVERQPISFHSVYFDFDKADLTPDAKAELDRAAQTMMDNPDVVLELQGNTCSMGPASYNKALGDRRAKSVHDYLVSKGISSDRLKTVSFGLAQPKHPNTTREGRSKNRRVDLVILK